ncbi:hypothetical protein GIB67_038629, partial [Kingdonia uniflora]
GPTSNFPVKHSNLNSKKAQFLAATMDSMEANPTFKTLAIAETQMVEEQQQQSSSPPSPPPLVSPEPNKPSEDAPSPSPRPPLRFDPSRMLGIVRRKALIKDLAAVYHAECLTYCEELLKLQKKWDEQNMASKALGDMKKESIRQPKRMKKTR